MENSDNKSSNPTTFALFLHIHTAIISYICLKNRLKYKRMYRNFAVRSSEALKRAPQAARRNPDVTDNMNAEPAVEGEN